MIVLKPYKSLKGYLERFTLLQIGRLHIRLHRIDASDATASVHTHPFAYVSIILRGGYTEMYTDKLSQKEQKEFQAAGCALSSSTPLHQRVVRAGSIVMRTASQAHRLDQVQKGTLTLFISWKRVDNGWNLYHMVGHQNAPDRQEGIYLRTLYAQERYCKWQHGMWFVGANSVQQAGAQMQPSIDQTTQGLWCAPLSLASV